MKRRNLTVSAAIGLACWPAMAQVAPPVWLREKAEILEAIRQSACPPGADALQCAQALRAAAESRYGADQPYSCDLFQAAAEAYLGANERVQALATFRRLEVVAYTPTRRAYAAFRVGGILSSMNDRQGAIDAYGRCEEGIHARGVETDCQLFARSCLGKAEVLRLEGRREEAIASRTRLIGQPWTPRLRDELGGMALVENARDQFALGRVQEGKQSFDSFLGAFPAIGLQDGRRVLWRVERALAGRALSGIVDEGTTQELLAVWQDETVAGQPEIMVCASNLGTVLYQRGERPFLAHVLAAARGHFDAHELEWRGLEALRFERARAMYESITIDLIGELEMSGDRQGVIDTVTALLNRFPHTEHRAVAEAARARARRAE